MKVVHVNRPVVVEEVRAPGLELAYDAVAVRDLMLEAALAVPDVGVVLRRDVGQKRVGLLLVLQGLEPELEESEKRKIL